MKVKHYQLSLTSKEIVFTHKIIKGLKNIYISINKNNEIILKSSRLSQEKAKEIIKQKENWILKQLNKVECTKLKKHDKADLIYYLGKTYPIKIIESPDSKKITTTFDFNTFYIYIPDLSTFNFLDITKYIEAFYKKETEKIILHKLPFWQEKMRLSAKKITFRKMKRRLGSCNEKKEVTFNSHLIRLSEELINYVIVHEFAHLKEPNHSKRFWSLVSSFINDYKEKHKNALEFI